MALARRRLHVVALLMILVLVTPWKNSVKADSVASSTPTGVFSPGETPAVWSRTTGGASGGIDPGVPHGNLQSFKVVSTDSQDWSCSYPEQIPVGSPETLFTTGAWVKCTDAAGAQLSVVERSADGSVIDWSAASASISGSCDWTYLTAKFVPEPSAASVQLRLEGAGTGAYWIAGPSLTSQRLPVNPALKERVIVLRNPQITVTFQAHTATLTVVDRKAHATWTQSAQTTAGIIVLNAVKSDSRTIRASLLDGLDALPLEETIKLDPGKRKIDVVVSGDGPMAEAVSFPPAFAPHTGDALVVPNNEGLLYPAGDMSVQPYSMPLYGGHSGLSMPWYGIESQSTGAGVMTIVKTPDDADLNLVRPMPSTLMREQPIWEASKQRFAYPRKLEYIFLAGGGYVSQAKVYRRYAEAHGLVRTLAQKRAANPNVDLLVGSVDIWDWDPDPAVVCKELKDAGMKRVLWSNGGSPDALKQIDAFGYLTSCYDIYQDIYEPGSPAGLPKGNWPADLILDERGKPIVSWVDHETGPDGKPVSYTADACCSIPGLARARRKVPADLKTHAYTARFIDTITASPWRECYNPAHPTNRSQDRRVKMELLHFVADTEHLVTGCETGIDPAAPYADYFEGMMSLARYRLPNSGYNIGVYQKPTPDFLKYQIGTGYRVPLFELVYHDCIVSTWYWGDASNAEPEVWDQRDLYNILYGTEPVFILDHDRWDKQRDRFMQSYRNVCTATRAVGYAQMVSHAFLTPDHNVQQTKWSNGKVITVNFGDSGFTLPTGKVVSGKSFVVE